MTEVISEKDFKHACGRGGCLETVKKYEEQNGIQAASKHFNFVCGWNQLEIVKYLVSKNNSLQYEYGFDSAIYMENYEICNYLIKISNFHKTRRNKSIVDLSTFTVSRYYKNTYIENHRNIHRVNLYKKIECRLQNFKKAIIDSLITNKKIPQEVFITHLVPFLYISSWDDIN